MPNIQIDKINYVIKGETGNIINLDISENDQTYTKTFLTDSGNEVANISSTTMTHRIIKTSSSNNKNIFFDMIGSDSIIYALFDFKDVAVKSSTGIDLYAPHLSSDPIGFCTVVNSNSKIISYGISEATSISPLIKGTNLRDTREDRIAGLTNSMFWNYKMIESGNKTYLGIPLSNLTLADTDLDDEVSSESVSSYFQFLQSYGKLSTDIVSTFFDPKYNLENINRNYIYQIPLGGSNVKMFNDFNSGNINGDFVIGKNPYNSEYSMDMSSVSELKNARHYDGIGTIGGRVFFKYHDDIDYKHNSDETLSTSLSSFLQNLSTEISNNILKINNFQKVEMLDSISQFKAVSQHKSNLLSIKIKKLFDNITDETILNNLTKIKEDISRKISKIVESFAPAHTQLFDIIFDNKSGAEENSQSNMGIIGDIIFLFTNSAETEISGLTKRGQYTTCLKIPKDVTSILDGALNQSFENIIFLTETGNTTFEVKNNSLYEISSNTLISYPVNNSAASYIISEDTSAIYTSAFYNSRNLNILYKPLLLSNITDLDVPEHLTIFDYYHYIIHFLNDGNEDTNLMPPLSVYTYDTYKLGENKFTKTGYKFKYWNYNFNGITKEISDNSYIETHLSPDYTPVNLSAIWDQITYYVEFSKDNDNSISGNNFSISCLYDTEYNLSDYSNIFTKTGYTLDGWKRSATNETFSKDDVISNLTTVDKNKIIFNVEFDPHTYIVGFDDVSDFISSGIINETLSVKYDSANNLSNFINKYGIISTNDYILSAWTFGKKFTQPLPLYEDEINGFKTEYFSNLTTEDGVVVYLSSVWTPKYYVEYNSGVNDNSVSGNTLSQYFAFGDKARKLSKNGFSRELYFFDGWECDNEEYSDEAEVKDLTSEPGKKLTFTARWNEKFTIIFDGNGATSGSMENQYFALNNSQNLYENKFTRTGYEFKGWSFEKYRTDDSDITSSEINYYFDGHNPISFTVDNSNRDKFNTNRQLTLYAVWEPNVYKVKFNKNF
jgi:hypothetical protein